MSLPVVTLNPRPAAVAPAEPVRIVEPADDSESALTELSAPDEWDPNDVSSNDLFEPLHGPPPDADLDVWLLATAALMEDGG
jgi:hypothetical protein